MTSTMAEEHVQDPYRACEEHCNHDLGRGALISELLGGDGPYPPAYLIASLTPSRAQLFNDDLEPVEEQATV